MPRRSGRPNDYTWRLGTVSHLALSSGTISATILVGDRRETLVRTRGEVLIWMDASGTIGDLVQVGWGLLVVPQGLGGTVVSSPIGDSDAPWLAYGVCTLAFEATGAAGLSTLDHCRTVVDSKAMRKIMPDQDVVFVAENVTLGSAQSVNLVASIRALTAH